MWGIPEAAPEMENELNELTLRLSRFSVAWCSQVGLRIGRHFNISSPLFLTTLSIFSIDGDLIKERRDEHMMSNAKFPGKKDDFLRSAGRARAGGRWDGNMDNVTANRRLVQ